MAVGPTRERAVHHLWTALESTAFGRLSTLRLVFFVQGHMRTDGIAAKLVALGAGGGYHHAVEGIAKPAEERELTRLPEIDGERPEAGLRSEQGLGLRHTDDRATALAEERQLDRHDRGHPRGCAARLHVAQE